MMWSNDFMLDLVFMRFNDSTIIKYEGYNFQHDRVTLPTDLIGGTTTNSVNTKNELGNGKVLT